MSEQAPDGYLSAEEAERLLRDKIRELGLGGNKIIAERAGVSSAMMSHVMSGRSPIPESVATAIGLKRVILFKRGRS
jgi:hypothetical protein